MNRRFFIKTSCAAVAAAAFSGLSCTRNGSKLPSFGIITGNTGGDWVKNNPKEALREIAHSGYTELEFGGDFGLGVAGLKKFLSEVKLKALIGSTSMQAMNDEDLLKKHIEACKELEQEYIACYWPWTDNGQNKKLDDWKKVAENLNKGGVICKRNGIKLIYHNHDIEFFPTEGQIPFDTLMTHLDPQYADIELDLYWITKGGQSPVDYIRKYPGRYPVYHVKDMAKDKDFACVGDGIINFGEIFKHNKTAGVKHFMVEHDKPADPEQCIASAARYLSGLRF